MDTRCRQFKSIYPSLTPVPGRTNVYTVQLVKNSVVEKVIRECRYLAEKSGSNTDIEIQFKWTGVTVCVKKGSNCRSLHRDWQRACNGTIPYKEVGPIATGY